MHCLYITTTRVDHNNVSVQYVTTLAILADSKYSLSVTVASTQQLFDQITTEIVLMPYLAMITQELLHVDRAAVGFMFESVCVIESRSHRM